MFSKTTGFTQDNLRNGIMYLNMHILQFTCQKQWRDLARVGQRLAKPDHYVPRPTAHPAIYHDDVL